MTLGARIAALRKERGLSQEGLGELVGVSRQAVSKWESDSALPDVNNCVALSKAFGITLSQLLELEEEPSAPGGELTEEQLAMVQAIAERYLASLPRPKSWRQRRKWPWVLAASVLLVLATVAAEWVQDLNRTVSSMSNEMVSVHDTVSQAVEEQVNAALAEVTSLVKEKRWTLEQVDLVTVFTAVASCINNIGPGLEIVGPMGNFSSFSDFTKLLLSFDMLVGRLEVFPMLLLFAPSIWRQKLSIRQIRH